MEKLKVMTILGTRPEIIRLSACIKTFDRLFNHILVHTGQNYDYTLNGVFFKELNLREPDYFLECVGETLGTTLGRIIENTYTVMEQEKPDALLILGDTNSTLCAIAAKRLKIPIFHMEAGNRCWDWNVPEMINRKIVDHISDINLPYTEHSRRYLLSEGLDGKTIFVTGSPMREVIEEYRSSFEKSDVLGRLGLKEREYFLVSAHREENIDHEENFISLMSAINHLAQTYHLPVIYSTHPRTMRFIRQRSFKFHPLVQSLEPFGYIDYSRLQIGASCVLSDSGTLSEESSILGFPAVLIRTSTERPEVLDKGSIVIGGITPLSVSQAVEMAMTTHDLGGVHSKPEAYNDTDVSSKVARIIQSYTPIVNRTVWGNQ